MLETIPTSAAERVLIETNARRHPTDENKRLADLLRRATAEQVLAGTPGLLADLPYGDLISFRDRARRVSMSSNGGRGPLPMPPAGASFTRPRVTDESLPDVQSAEFVQPASQLVTVVPDEVVKGGPTAYIVKLSEQLLDGAENTLLQQLLEDVAAGYGARTEAKACAAVEAAATTSLTCSLTATADVFHHTLADALVSVYVSSLTVPDTIYCAPDRLGFVLGLTDTTGQPVYESDAPPLGLNLCPSPTFSAGFIAVGASQYVETWERCKGFVQAPSPGQLNQAGGPNMPADPLTLSFWFAYRGYFTARALPQGLCKLAP
jgi:hypothetical protein